MIDQDRIRQAVRMIIEAIGEDPTREGLVETPRRIAEMYEEIFSGSTEDVAEHLRVTFTEEHNEIVLIKDIHFYSMCEHHFLPFFGHAHVAYLPEKGRVTGLSKIARVVDGFARRPQMQERLTKQIANTIEQVLQPQGVAVVVEAEHLCMNMRGVKKPGSTTVTSAMRGIFQTDATARAEVLSLITRRGPNA